MKIIITKWIGLITLLVICTGCNLLQAQGLKRFTIENGLPSNHIYDIEQDLYGTIWLATNRGVVKFDGNEFSTFTIKDGLPTNDIWRLEIDMANRLWFFSNSSFQGFIKNDSIFLTYTPPSIAPRNIFKDDSSIYINDMILDKDTWRQRKHISYRRQQLEQRFNKLYSLEKNALYLGFLKQSPFAMWALVNNQIILVDSQMRVLRRLDVNGTVPSGSLRHNPNAFGQLNKDIFCFTLNTGSILINLKKNKAIFLSFSSPIQKDYVRIKLGNELQFSTINRLFVIDNEFNRVDTVKHPGIQWNRALKDRTGNYWFINPSGGLTFKSNLQNKAVYYLQNKKVKLIAGIDSTLFAGVDGDGIYLSKGNHFRKEMVQGSVRNFYQLKKMRSDPETFYLISNQIHQWKNGQFSSPNLKTEPTHYSAYLENTKDIEFKKNKTYLLHGNGLSSFDAQTGKTYSHFNRTDLKHILLFKGILYLAGSNGLFWLNGDSIQPVNATHPIVRAPANTLTVTEDMLIVGTDGSGIYFYDGERVRVPSLTDGLIIEKIIRDNDKIWMATHDGVKVLQINPLNWSESHIIDAFYTSDGLLQNNTNDIYLARNYLYVATDIGLSKIDLTNPSFKLAPGIQFKSNSDTILLSRSNGNHWEISFSVLNYPDQNHLSFSYRLLPLHEEWLTTPHRNLNFSNLTPDHYTLEVKVTDHHGNSRVKKQHLIISAAWWQTLWARIPLGIMAIGLTTLFTRKILIYSRKKEQQKLQKQNQMNQIELKALRSQMNPHFVYNSLNAIQYYIDKQNKEVYQTYLARFSRLIRQFFEYAGKNIITLSEEIEMLRNYLSMEKLRFREKLTYAIKVDPKLDAGNTRIPSMLLQPIVENAVNHGIFHQDDGGHIQVSLSHLSMDTYSVTIEDNGIGIQQSKKIQKQSAKGYQSHSTEVLNERLRLLQELKDWDITFETEDRSSSSEESGTIVTLTFKQL